MQTLTHQAKQTINFQRTRLAPYMPLLGKSIAKTYLVPFGGLMVANVLVNILMMQVPGLFSGLLGSAASLVIFFGVLYYGWRWAEQRWHGTSLFVQFTALNKSRRILSDEIELENPSDAAIQQYMSDFVTLVNSFVETMNEYGLITEIVEAE